jgi:uncharacterized protein DUF1573
MQRLRFLFVVSLVIQTIVGTVARAELRCDEALVTLGEVKAGRPLTHRFTFTNRGTEVVQITAVQPSCGCLNPRLGERRLRPGDSGVLMLEVNTLTAAVGPNAWRVQLVYSSGGPSRELTLALRATVVSEITVRPAALVLQTESSVGHEVTLTDGRTNPLTATAVQTTDPMLRATLQKPRLDDAGHKVQTVRLDVEPAFPEGRHEETLQIFTSDSDYPELRVPVTVVKQARTAVRATPGEITMTAHSGALPARVVLLRGAEGIEVEVERAECADSAVRCTWAKGPGSMATLRVQIDGERISADGLHATLLVRLAQPAGAKVTIPVNCAFASSGTRQPGGTAVAGEK